MNKNSFVFATIISFFVAITAYAGKVNMKSLGHVVPQVSGTVNVYNPVVGEIVYDSSVGKFFGYDQTSNWQALAAPVGSSVPSGAIFPFAGSSAPAGYQIANGSEISRTTYSTLFAVIGTTYGAGDGSTTFNLPDLRGLFVRGVGTQTIGGVSYTATLGTKQNDATKKNGLYLSDPSHSHGFTSPTGGTSGLYGGYVNGAQTAAQGTTYSTTGITLNSTDTETRPANMGLTYIIKE